MEAANGRGCQSKFSLTTTGGMWRIGPGRIKTPYGQRRSLPNKARHNKRRHGQFTRSNKEGPRPIMKSDEPRLDELLAQFDAQAEPYDDAAEAVNGLASAGLTVGLFSNADDDFLQPAITRSGLRFSVIQTSQSLRAYKPHPVAFEALADRLGRAPEEILYVGDSAYADVHGAVRAGLRSAWVRRSHRHPHQPDRRRVVHSGDSIKFP